MAIEPTIFRIIPDPQTSGKWAFVDNVRGQQVGGFPTAKAARKAYNRERKEIHG